MWGQEGKCEGKPPTVGAFVWREKALGLGDGGGWTPQAVGSVQQRR